MRSTGPLSMKVARLRKTAQGTKSESAIRQKSAHLLGMARSLLLYHAKLLFVSSYPVI